MFHSRLAFADSQKDLCQEPLALPDAVDALKAGKVDALAYDDTIPNGVIRDLAATPSMTIKLFDHGEAIARYENDTGGSMIEELFPGGPILG